MLLLLIISHAAGIIMLLLFNMVVWCVPDVGGVGKRHVKLSRPLEPAAGYVLPLLGKLKKLNYNNSKMLEMKSRTVELVRGKSGRQETHYRPQSQCTRTYIHIGNHTYIYAHLIYILLLFQLRSWLLGTTGLSARVYPCICTLPGELAQLADG